MSETKDESHWMLNWGIEIVGKRHFVDKAVAALSAHADLVAVVERLAIDEGGLCTCALGKVRNGGQLPCAICQALALLARVREAVQS